MSNAAVPLRGVRHERQPARPRPAPAGQKQLQTETSAVSCRAHGPERSVFLPLRGSTTATPYLELNLAPTAEDMPDMALALIRAIIAAADQDQDEMTVLLVHGKPAAVIAPYGHERRPGAAAEIRFDQTAPPEARLVLTDTWGGSIRMSTEEFRQLAREGVSSRFDAMAQIAESWP
jgi:hypothetical protein